MQKFAYNGKFEGNILVLRRTDCEKTIFVQRHVVNNIFGKLKKTEWASQIKLSKQCEAQIQSCFNCPLDFYSLKNADKLEDLLEEFMKGREGVVKDTDSAAAKMKNWISSLLQTVFQVLLISLMFSPFS